MASSLTPTPIPIHLSSGQQGWKALPQLAYQILLTPANQVFQQTGSPFFHYLNAVKAHMHVQYKLGPKLKKVSNHLSMKCYTKYQELIKEGIVKKDISNSFWKNTNVTSGQKKMSRSAAQI